MKAKEIFYKILKSKTSKFFDENTVIRDLGLDSIDMVEMITEFEDECNVTIPTSEINGIKTIKDILVILEKITK